MWRQRRERAAWQGLDRWAPARDLAPRAPARRLVRLGVHDERRRRARGGPDVLLRDRLRGRVVDVHADPVLVQRQLAVLLQEEVERLRERAVARGAEQVRAQVLDVRVLAADDAERLEHVAVDVARG